MGPPARGVQDVQDRQAALPGPLRVFHRALLGAILTEDGPPDLAVVGRLAAELKLELRAALAALAAADLVHTDPAAARVRVAYPFSGHLSAGPPGHGRRGARPGRRRGGRPAQLRRPAPPGTGA
jgi:hypothetical protein